MKLSRTDGLFRVQAKDETKYFLSLERETTYLGYKKNELQWIIK